MTCKEAIEEAAILMHLAVKLDEVRDRETNKMTKNSAAIALGKLGGLKRSANLTKERRQEIARKASLTRWSRIRPTPPDRS